jgi:hypothetical protein
MSELFLAEIEEIKKEPKKRGPKPKNRTKEELSQRRKDLRLQKKAKAEAEKTKKDKKNRPTGTAIAINNIVINNNDMVDIDINKLDKIEVQKVLTELEKLSETTDKKRKSLTIQELKFIDYRYRLGLDIKVAMNLAGYKDLRITTLYLWAKKIGEKYERSTEDKRIIMRALGVGEIWVIKNMARLALGAQSEVAQAQATTTLGKWLELDKGISQGSEGVTVIIQGPGAVQVNQGGAPQAGPTTPDQAGFNHPTPSQPGKPIVILK